MQPIVHALLAKGVRIPCPEAVSFDNIDPGRIARDVTLYPGTHLCGAETYIGEGCIIGQGGGAYVENCQIGRRCVLMQGNYRDATIFDGVEARQGAELREACLLEEGVSLGHTVGLKQTVLMTHVVAGSLIDFCDALMAGGRSRREHSEIGSCMALYNFTPQGDKFASYFGDVVRGVFLDGDPIFIGGQTQIVSPVHIGFGTVVAAGTKLAHDVGDGMFVTGSAPLRERRNRLAIVHRADEKLRTTLGFLDQLYALRAWYTYVRQPALASIPSYGVLVPSAIRRIDQMIAERVRRLQKFAGRLMNTMEQTDANVRASYVNALSLLAGAFSSTNTYLRRPRVDMASLALIADALKGSVLRGMSYPDAVRALPDKLKNTGWVDVGD